MKLSAVFGQRDVIIGTTIIEAMCKVAPDKDAGYITDEVLRSMMHGSEVWENTILPDMYGTDKAEKIKTKLKELRELTLE